MSLRQNSLEEKKAISPDPSVEHGRGIVSEDVVDPLDEFEVFKKTSAGVDFRTVGWVRASVIFLKSKSLFITSLYINANGVFLLVIFATGVLSIPTAMYSLGERTRASISKGRTNFLLL